MLGRGAIMQKSTRQMQIMNLLEGVPALSVRDLADSLKVSEMTIRRDLNDLVLKDYITLIQGVAILNKNTDGTSFAKDYTLTLERQNMRAEKERIGRLAATLLEPEDTILIDTGTTTEQLLQHLPNGIPLTIMGYNFNTLMAIHDRENTDIYFGGGYYHHNTQMFESQETISLIGRLCINKFFVSAAGISDKGAVSCIEQHELSTKQSGLKNAIMRILLADSSKFGKIRPCMFAKLEDFDIVITDRGIDPAWLDRLQRSNIKCLLA